MYLDNNSLNNRITIKDGFLELEIIKVIVCASMIIMWGKINAKSFCTSLN